MDYYRYKKRDNHYDDNHRNENIFENFAKINWRYRTK